MSTQIRHGTLSANVEMHASYTLTTTALGQVTTNEVGITHKANVTDKLLYARVDGTTATVAGNDCFVILPGRTRWIPRPADEGSSVSVSLISDGAVAWEVEIP